MNNKYGTGLAALAGILVLAAGIACGSELDNAAPGASATPDGAEPVDQNLVCMSTLAVQLPIEFVNAGDPISTAFDGINVASCTFPVAIESVRVTITNVETGAKHTQVFSLPEASDRVSFPLGDDVLSLGTAEIVAPGEYERVLEAVAVDGEVYDLTDGQGALDTVTVRASDADQPVVQDVLCMSTLAAQLPIEFEHASDAVSTAFDGINVANCTFPVAIESVRVTITNLETGAKHTQVFSLPQPSDQVSFPLGEDVLSLGTAEIVAPGEYARVLEAIAVDGVVYNLTADQGALDTVTVLPADADEPVVQDVLCISTLAVQLPIEFAQAGDSISTAFDGINVANCTFPVAIESVKVTITNVETGAKHTQLFSLPEPSDQVSFPLAEDALSLGTAEVVAPGEYERVLEAVAVDGQLYDLTADQGALGAITVIAS